MLKFSTIKILPRWLIVLIDLAIISISIVLAYLLRFNFDLAAIAARNFYAEVGVFVLFNLFSFLLFKTYSGIIRYTGFQDGLRIVYTLLLAAALITGFNLIYLYQTEIRFVPFSVIVISYFVSSFSLIVYRIMVKTIFSYYSHVIRKQENVVIYGAGQLGLMTKQIIENDSSTNLKVVAFLDDDKSKQGKDTDGVKIYKSNDIDQLIYLTKEIIIAIKGVSKEKKNQIVDLCLEYGMKVRQVPAIEQWVKGELSVKQIREVKIEDLLGRESIRLNNIKVGHDISNKCILITGAAGSIGAELTRQVANYSPSYLILYDQSETGLFEIETEINFKHPETNLVTVIGDIINIDRLENIFKKYQPDIVYHAAAYKHVPMMEGNPAEAVLCNVLGTKVVADLAHKYHAYKFVMISTDKAVNPTSVMGASKRIAEMYVQSLSNFKVSLGSNYAKYVTTRFGNVLGSNGSVIPLFKKQIESGGPITVTHPEITRYFMTIPEACELVLEAGAMGEGGEIFIFDMGESIKIVDLARKMIVLSGLEVNKDVEIHFTGLREGEKLYEELLNNTENARPTHHKKILIARVSEEPYLKVSKEVENLIRIAENKDEIELVGYMKKLVPEFLSNFSRFEALDKGKEISSN